VTADVRTWFADERHAEVLACSRPNVVSKAPN
jgi:hypothetical protein